MHPPAKSSQILPPARRAASEDEWGARDVFVSWMRRRNRPDVLGHRAGVAVTRYSSRSAFSSRKLFALA